MSKLPAPGCITIPAGLFKTIKSSSSYIISNLYSKGLSDVFFAWGIMNSKISPSDIFLDGSIVILLLICGKIRQLKGRIETLITRSSKNRQMMEVSNTKGKNAITNYKTIEIFEGKNIPTLSLLECKLETGRTHQIRVHMNYLGNSIVGDDKYKKKFKKIKNINPILKKNLINLNRQFLHAKIIGFIHPRKNKEMIFDSILPKDLEIILKMLRNSGK